MGAVPLACALLKDPKVHKELEDLNGANKTQKMEMTIACDLSAVKWFQGYI